MSRFEIKMPKLGESITEGTIISWSVQVGDIIKEDDVLFEVNTAKVSAEIPSPVEGKVVEILFKEGDTVAVGTVVAIVDIGGENSEDEDSVEALQSSATDESVAVVSKAASEETPQVKAVKSEEERWYSPVVLQLAREAGIQPKELDTIPGTGYQGRVSKKDIKSYIFRKQSGGTTTAQPAAKLSTQPVASIAPQPVATAPAQSSAKPAVTSDVQRTTPASGTFSAEGVEVKEMDRVRKVIADHMVMSKHTSPHVTNVVEVDVTKLVKWRDKNKDAFFRREGVKLTYMPVITEAVAKALAASGIKPEKNIVFAFFGAEERGIKGAIHYLNHPTFPLDKTMCMLNIDMVGNGNGLSVWGAESFPAVAKIFAGVNDRWLHRDFEVTPYVSYSQAGGDEFSKRGIPALYIATTEELKPMYYHDPRDREETLTPEIMEDAARMLFLALPEIVKIKGVLREK